MEKLSFEKFEPNKIIHSSKVMGGKKADCPIPNGGCSCDTSGGTLYNNNGSVLCTYTSDNNTYNANGTSSVTDFDGISRQD